MEGIVLVLQPIWHATLHTFPLNLILLHVMDQNTGVMIFHIAKVMKFVLYVSKLNILLNFGSAILISMNQIHRFYESHVFMVVATFLALNFQIVQWDPTVLQLMHIYSLTSNFQSSYPIMG